MTPNSFYICEIQKTGGIGIDLGVLREEVQCRLHRMGAQCQVLSLDVPVHFSLGYRLRLQNLGDDNLDRQRARVVIAVWQSVGEFCFLQFPVLQRNAFGQSYSHTHYTLYQEMLKSAQAGEEQREERNPFMPDDAWREE